MSFLVTTWQRRGVGEKGLQSLFFIVAFLCGGPIEGPWGISDYSHASDQWGTVGVWN